MNVDICKLCGEFRKETCDLIWTHVIALNSRVGTKRKVKVEDWKNGIPPPGCPFAVEQVMSSDEAQKS